MRYLITWYIDHSLDVFKVYDNGKKVIVCHFDKIDNMREFNDIYEFVQTLY